MTSTTFIQNSANSALTSCLLSILAKQCKHSMRDPYFFLVKVEKVYLYFNSFISIHEKNAILANYFPNALLLILRGQ